MRFDEAEAKYRELEEQLLHGELKEEEFLVQAAQLRAVDQEGRRWMISARTGRWLVHDGQQWVFATPPPTPDDLESPAGAAALEGEAAAGQAEAERKAESPPRRTRSLATVPRFLLVGIAALLLLGCLIGGGISAWVFLLRDWGAEPTPVAEAPTDVPLVQTYTPRPATPTYTPTFTPTPSRTPTPTNTPLATDTPTPTNTPPPTPSRTLAPPTATGTPTVVATQVSTRVTSVAAVSATPSSTATPAPPSGQTYTVQAGDTLFEIALEFGVSVRALAEANGIDNTSLIRPGMVLVIPIPGTTPQAPTATLTPTWTPIVVRTPTATGTTTPRATSTPTPTTASATRTPTPTPTTSGPTATPRPTNTPRPTATPTAQPVALAGKIAFTVWNPFVNKYELYVSLIDGTGRNLLGEGYRQPQFRQDGNLLAVNGDGSPNFEHLVTMNPSGGNKVEVSNYSEDSFPSWSPDGAIVAYSSASWGDGEIRLGIVNDMFGKQQDWIKIGTTEIRGEYPFWMADGRVVYHGCDFLGDQAACGLYWVGAGGGTYQRLTNDRSDTAPAGYGSRVAFMSARDGNWEVYAVNMDGSGLVRLTNNNALDGLPTWSPDGKSVAFVSNRDGAWGIWVMNANGSNQRKLFDLGGSYGSGAYDWTRERISWAP